MRIEDMSAGREMDALVAEKVMGWKLYICGSLQLWLCDRLGGRVDLDTFQSYSFGLTGWLADAIEPSSEDEALLDEWIQRLGENWRGIWHPSTDIAAAWQVVEKLAEHRIIISLMDQMGWEANAGGNIIADDLWRVMFMDDEAHQREAPRDEIWLDLVEADTAPLAICRAALLACGVKDT